MKKIEKTLHVTIIFRDDKLKLIGGEKDCDRAKTCDRAAPFIIAERE